MQVRNGSTTPSIQNQSTDSLIWSRVCTFLLLTRWEQYNCGKNVFCNYVLVFRRNYLRTDINMGMSPTPTREDCISWTWRICVMWDRWTSHRITVCRFKYSFRHYVSVLVFIFISSSSYICCKPCCQEKKLGAF